MCNELKEEYKVTMSIEVLWSKPLSLFNFANMLTVIYNLTLPHWFQQMKLFLEKLKSNFLHHQIHFWSVHGITTEK